MNSSRVGKRPKRQRKCQLSYTLSRIFPLTQVPRSSVTNGGNSESVSVWPLPLAPRRRSSDSVSGSGCARPPGPRRGDRPPPRCGTPRHPDSDPAAGYGPARTGRHRYSVSRSRRRRTWGRSYRPPWTLNGHGGPSHCSGRVTSFPQRQGSGCSRASS